MTLEDDEVVRPGPDDSVAPGVLLGGSLSDGSGCDDPGCPVCYRDDPDQDHEDARQPVLQRVQRTLDPLAFLLPYRPLLVSATLLSGILTWHFAATGQWILALLV